MWINSDDVKGYTESEEVKNRAPEKIDIDILRAQYFITAYTRSSFDDELPEPVKIAAIILAEHFAKTATVDSRFKSEHFDEYSYTTAEVSEQIQALNLSSLLDAFVEDSEGGAPQKSKVFMRMRLL